MKIQYLKILTLFIFFNEMSMAQDAPYSIESKKNKSEVISNSRITSNLDTYNKQFETYNNKEIKTEKIISDYNQRFIEEKIIRIREENKTEQYTFDLITSIGKNINFGGVWDEIAVMNFSPRMYIQPVDFLNIYANYNLSNFIPLTDIEITKEHIKSFAFQSIAILALDNFSDILFDSKNWITSLIDFTLKNLAINLLIKPTVSRKNNHTLPWAEDEYYYYSLNLRF